jgi:hypothetical protein
MSLAQALLPSFALGLIAVNEWWVSVGSPPPIPDGPQPPAVEKWWAPIDAPLESPTAPGLMFSGPRRDFLGLVARGAALELITVGFYRFWLATDIRRHLWTNTQVDGDAAEYTGRGKELLVGFLFALAIMVPIYVGYFLIGIEVERLKALASIPLFVFFYVFGQFAIYRARRYRLHAQCGAASGSGWTAPAGPTRRGPRCGRC